MIAREDLPEDAADWKNVRITLERLEPDNADACPQGMDEILEYVRNESADLDEARPESLRFLRTARIGDTCCWIWRFTESDGVKCYLTVSLAPDGSSHMGLSDANGLSPEQYMLAEYYDEIYW